MTFDLANGGRLRLSPTVEMRLRAHHLRPGKSTESLSYALGHAWEAADGRTTVVIADPEAVLFFAPDCFVSQGYGHITLEKSIKAQVFHRAVACGYTAVVDIHDHHFTDVAQFSGTDDRDDLATARYVAETVQAFMPIGKRMVAAALLLSQGDWAARLVRGAQDDATFVPLRVDVAGEQFTCHTHLPEAARDARFARQSLLVDPRRQQLLAQSHAVVVGGGGTGSVALEGLLRLGVGTVSVIDADRVEASNLNRLQAAGPADVGRLKIDVFADHARRIAPQARVQGVATDCMAQEARELLEQADFIVGCVDNGETRWWLNHLAAQYMIPWFDCGVAVFAQPRPHYKVRVNVILPGVTACGHCGPVEFYERKLPSRFLDAESLRIQREAGYVADRPDEVAPSVYPVNQQAVAWLLQEVMNWYCGWMPVASSVYWRSDSRTIERVGPGFASDAPVSGCPVCDAPLGSCREGRLPAQGADADLDAAARALEAESPAGDTQEPLSSQPPERSTPWPN